MLVPRQHHGWLQVMKVSLGDTFIQINNKMFGINPQIHGFKTFYYGIGILRK